MITIKENPCRARIYCVNSKVQIPDDFLQIKNIKTNEFTWSNIFPAFGDIRKTIESLVRHETTENKK
ncbi:MAG: hypothetical protein C4522_22525 [Desulfobacteraceae bacterium]|nr:MAG: hypothetical protein C4522_22525 [Desulfobacteraceae bacterium]